MFGGKVFRWKCVIICCVNCFSLGWVSMVCSLGWLISMICSSLCLVVLRLVSRCSCFNMLVERFWVLLMMSMLLCLVVCWVSRKVFSGLM